MKNSLGDKSARVLKFLIGFQNPRIRELMATYGFTDADAEEGWRLLKAATLVTMTLPIAFATGTPDTISRLDAWENRWFPIVRATLERRFPSIALALFGNLTQTSGPAVVLGVGSFVERIDILAAAARAGDTEAAAALAILETRGLRANVLDEARALLDVVPQSRRYATTWYERTQAEKEQLAQAEKDLWSWYLEWSRIARVAIRSRALLRQMGFRQRGRAPVDEGAEGVEASEKQESRESPEPHHAREIGEFRASNNGVVPKEAQVRPLA